MLVIVPYLVQHPGSALPEVATLYDVPRDQLRRDLDLLFMSGLPPYGPGDLIDVEVDEDERVWIRMADHFSRPLRSPARFGSCGRDWGPRPPAAMVRSRPPVPGARRRISRRCGAPRATTND